MKRETHTIDASGRILGRLAVEVAGLLRGKGKPDFEPYKDIGDFVIINNIHKIKVSGKKFDQKMYHSHSGYLGSLKSVPFSKLFGKNPGLILKKAVRGMMPVNKLRAKQLKRLTINGKENY